MSAFIGNGLLFVAILGAIAVGAWYAWKRGKFARIGFIPKPPPEETKP